MAHYAFLDDENIVTEVIVGIDETEFIENTEPHIWYGNLKNQRCVRTSYNGKIRKQFAGIGCKYDEIADVFISPKPYESWVLDTNYDWQPPKAKPISGKWKWNEDLVDWEKYTEYDELV